MSAAKFTEDNKENEALPAQKETLLPLFPSVWRPVMVSFGRAKDGSQA